MTDADKDSLKPLYFAALEGGEQKAQAFFEEHSEVFPLPYYIGHHLDWNALVSKYPLDTSLITDFMYVTRTSGDVNVVFVELEEPNKKIFTPKDINLATSPAFAQAEGQIRGWKTYVDENHASMIKRICRFIPYPWLKMARVHFKFVLIYGRDSEMLNRDERRTRFRNLSGPEFHYMTYDSIWRQFERNQEPRKKHILRLTKEKFTFKRLASEPTNIFAYLSPSNFEVSTEDRATLLSRGYDLGAWENGELLGNGGKLPLRLPLSPPHKPSTP